MNESDPGHTPEAAEPIPAAAREPEPAPEASPTATVPGGSNAASARASTPTFVCADCGKRSAKSGDCSACGEGPLLDAADPSVLTALREADVQRRLKRERLLRWLAIPVAVVPVLALVATAPFVLDLVPLPIPFGNPIKVLVAMTLAAFGVSKALGRLFPAKALFSDGDAPTASTADVAAAMRRGGTRRVAIVVGALVAIGALVAGLSAVIRLREAQERARVNVAMATLRTCLVGEMKAGETLAQRTRRIQLSTGAVTPSPDWPERCAQHGDKLFAQLEPRGPAARLRELLAGKGGCETGCQGAGLLASIQDLAAAARAAQLLEFNVPDVEGPPLTEMNLLETKSFEPLGPKDMQLRDSTVLADGAVALLYQTSGGKLQVCTVDADARGVGCAPVPDEARVAASSAKLARGEREPLLYGITHARVTGGRDALGNERTPEKPGEAQKTEVERGAFWASSGARAALLHAGSEGIRNGVLLERDGSSFEMVTVSEGQESSRRTLDLPAGAKGPWVVDDFVVHVAADGDKGYSLFVRGSRDSGAKSMGPLRGDSSGTPAVCRAEAMTALVLGARAETHVSFVGKSGFSAPVSAGEAIRVGPEPAPPPPPPVPRSVSTASAAASSASAAPSTPASSRFDVRGPKDNPDPHIARQQALRDAEEFGMIGMLNSGAGGDPNAPTAPWGRDSSPMGGLSGFGGLGGVGALGRPAARRGDDELPRITSAAIDGDGVSCAGGSVTRTWLSPKGSVDEVHQVRCKAEGCSHSYARIRGLGVKNLWLATTLGDSVLLVFRGALGDVRMRMAPLAELGSATDTVIMESPEYGGPETGESHVLESAAAAMILFRGESLFGLRIGANGRHGVVQAR